MHDIRKWIGAGIGIVAIVLAALVGTGAISSNASTGDQGGRGGGQFPGGGGGFPGGGGGFPGGGGGFPGGGRFQAPGQQQVPSARMG